jgi:hypothetical protein
MENTSMIDASALYALFFGSEQFEYIIGDLQITTQAKAFMEHGLPSLPVEILQFKQRKREVQLALNLAKKIESYVDGDTFGFQERIRQEASALSETVLGAALLAVIGTSYVNAASAESSATNGVWVWMLTSSQSIYDGINSIVAGFNAATKALELQELQSNAEKKDAAAGSKSSSSSQFKNGMGQPFGPGPNATEQEIQQFRDKTKDMSLQLLNLFWLLVKFDINSTLASVCKKVLKDHSVDESVRSKRIEAVTLIGKEYLAKGAKPEDGINDLITRIGPQTGLFGDAPKGAGNFNFSGGASKSSSSVDEPSSPGPSSFSPSTKYAQNGGKLDYDDEAVITDLLGDVPEMSPGDLKSHIASIGGVSNDCIEKKDLQHRLRQLLLGRLPDEVSALSFIILAVGVLLIVVVLY